MIELLKLDDIAFHAGQFRYGNDAPATVGKTLGLHDDVDGRSDLRTDRFMGHGHAGHADHLFETG